MVATIIKVKKFVRLSPLRAAIASERSTVKTRMMTMMLKNHSDTTADFAPLVDRDFDLYGKGIVVQVKPALHEVMVQSLHCEGGPEMSRVCTLLLRVAAGKDCTTDALVLLWDMSDAFDRRVAAQAGTSHD